jgi:hypothetical protein
MALFQVCGLYNSEPLLASAGGASVDFRFFARNLVDVICGF